MMADCRSAGNDVDNVNMSLTSRQAYEIGKTSSWLCLM